MRKAFNLGTMKISNVQKPGESSEEVSRRGMIVIQKLGNEVVRLSDLEGNEFTEPIKADRLKEYFTAGIEEWSPRELAEDLTQRDGKLIHACMHTRNISCIPFSVLYLFCIHRF